MVDDRDVDDFYLEWLVDLGRVFDMVVIELGVLVVTLHQLLLDVCLVEP